MELKLVQLPVTNLADIPARMRALADSIESGKVQTAQVIVLVEPLDPRTPEPLVYGWGQVGKIQYTMGLLQVVLHKLGDIALNPYGGRHNPPPPPPPA